ncbi:hypothetical protein BGX38DRAFT_1144308 [Terfezia claveryi]|nr:hypothetical protein BGX38DRAFT_1144308 [Terfezia claveryi]
MSSNNKDLKLALILRLTALADELGDAVSIIKELQKEVLINQKKDEVMTLMEKLTDIQQRGKQELRVPKDLLKHDEVSADMIKALETVLATMGKNIRFIEGEIGKKEKM